jgi:LemA protein
MFVTILILLAIACAGLAYFWYMKTVMNVNAARETLSSIDVQMKQRYDLIPNILTIAKKFMQHESELFAEITQLRQGVSQPYQKNNASEVIEHLASMNQLNAKLEQLRITAENYPELKSDATMVNAMQTYNEVESQISAARRSYNAAVTQLNNSIQIFPGNYLAKQMNVAVMPYFEAGATAKNSVNAKEFL